MPNGEQTGEAPPPPPPPEEGQNSIKYEIRDDRLQPSPRSASLHIPTSYSEDKPSTLIIALHGKAESPKEFEYHTQLSNEKWNPDAIVVYPEGIKHQWTGDPEAPPRHQVDDIGFINILIDHLKQSYSIDHSAIYVTGFSNGGGLAGLLAGDPTASAQIAAFAISSGAFYQDEALKEPLFSHLNPSRSPIPILEFHGDSDPVEHYDGKTTPDGPSYPILEWLQGWAKVNYIAKEPSQRESLSGGKVEKLSWDSDKASGVIQHYKISGFGHGWPTTFPLDNDEQRHGPTYFNATPIVLEFFTTFRLDRHS